MNGECVRRVGMLFGVALGNRRSDFFATIRVYERHAAAAEAAAAKASAVHGRSAGEKPVQCYEMRVPAFIIAYRALSGLVHEIAKLPQIAAAPGIDRARHAAALFKVVSGALSEPCRQGASVCLKCLLRDLSQQGGFTRRKAREPQKLSRRLLTFRDPPVVFRVHQGA